MILSQKSYCQIVMGLKESLKHSIKQKELYIDKEHKCEEDSYFIDFYSENIRECQQALIDIEKIYFNRDINK